MCKYVTISHTKSYSTIDRIFSGLLPANALSSYCLTFIMLSLLQRKWHDMQTLLLEYVINSTNWHNNNMNEKTSMHLKRQQKFHRHQFFCIHRYKLLEHPSKEK